MQGSSLNLTVQEVSFPEEENERYTGMIGWLETSADQLLDGGPMHIVKLRENMRVRMDVSF